MSEKKRSAIQSVKGTRDLLPPETALWAKVESVAREVFAAYGYQEIRTPILEQTELFVRGVGEDTDIVGKEMYTFEDKKGRSITLRPENTAAVARAFIEHGMQSWPSPVRLFYVGPQFRYERPQKGRYRQFSQIGAELIGDPGPATDGELLLMLMRFLGELKFSDLTVLLNTVGDDISRSRYREALVSYLQPLRDQLGADSRRRLESNPLRILDTKVEAERGVLESAPRLADFLTEESKQHFATVVATLEEAGVRHRIEPRLVRGLDYYTRTVFEIVAEGLGAQDAIVGGGRYDRLLADLGGLDIPAIGFAIGEDRLIDVLPALFRYESLPRPPLVVIGAGAVSAQELLRVAEELRDQKLSVVTESAGKSLGAALRRAAKGSSRFAVLIGEEELASNELTIRDLESGRQERCQASQLRARLEEWR